MSVRAHISGEGAKNIDMANTARGKFLLANQSTYTHKRTENSWISSVSCELGLIETTESSDIVAIFDRSKVMRLDIFLSV